MVDCHFKDTEMQVRKKNAKMPKKKVEEAGKAFLAQWFVMQSFLHPWVKNFACLYWFQFHLLGSELSLSHWLCIKTRVWLYTNRHSILRGVTQFYKQVKREYFPVRPISSWKLAVWFTSVLLSYIWCHWLLVLLKYPYYKQ